MIRGERVCSFPFAPTKSLALLAALYAFFVFRFRSL